MFPIINKMRCPFCKIDSMRAAGSGKNPIDVCSSCGAAWFDPGEIREVTEGRFPDNGDHPPGEGAAAGKESLSVRMARAWKKSRFLSCSRCFCSLAVIDFQNTNTPVFVCRQCGGLLAPREILEELACKFGLQRKNAALYDALGTSMASEMRRRLDRRYGSDNEFAAGDIRSPGLPVVVPLADAGETAGPPPFVTWGLLGLAVMFHVFCSIGIGDMDTLSARLALPSGSGFANVSGTAPFLAPFFHAGILPLAMGCLFLYVLGDNVEDRLGHVAFLLFFLAWGAVAGAAHVLWGKAGAPAALGSAGAVAGVLGAYLVFFPQVPISMYKGGEVVSVPAYLFACAWVVAQFLWGWGPLTDILNPAPYSLAGSLAGFAAGAATAVLWRSVEDPET